MILLYAAFFLLGFQQEPPTPITKIEPVTQPVLHCPAGWHVEVWHKGFYPYAGSMDDRIQTTIEPGYRVYGVPVVITSGDGDTDKDHPAKCVLDASLVKLKEVPPTTALWDTADGTLTTSTTFFTSSDPCGWSSFTYDAKTNSCRVPVTFSVDGKVTCTPVRGNKMVCSYKLPRQKTTPSADPCDGLACTGPVEMLPTKSSLYDLCRKNGGTIDQCKAEAKW